MSLVALALVSPDNSPIFISTYGQSSDPPAASSDPISDPFSSSPSTKFSFIIHSALDHLSSPTRWQTPKHLLQTEGDQNQQTSKTETAKNKNVQLGFLGHIVPIDQYRVYGYHGVNGVRLLCVIDEVFTSTLTPPSPIQTQQRFERSLHSLFYRIYRMYLMALCNPFHGIDGGENFIKGRVKDGKYWYPKFERGTRAIVEDFNESGGYS
ncbi:hypothetical protein TrST_g9370 [Triparma strigata]|uniref:Trafficking protein particle complex subunit n=1 Tax=Triparma strigata TaxID=1606541 RepID=A0A9W7BZS5_9STRA|nr:hypothetical protein TrST_g9370 [Triparma strigata]